MAQEQQAAEAAAAPQQPETSAQPETQQDTTY